ncbi:DUF2742 domain-containing protein [Mycolicibacterium porcinum]|uniref:DUF2742 domain-containing protein n=1 Tax=Mycolicibacterium porcinum TaxID=39693 RepID=UPI0031F97209
MNDGGPAQDRATTTTATKQVDTRDGSALASSQQVSWWSVHEHVCRTLEKLTSWPTLGTPAWCALSDDHPAKLAAMLDAAQHWALRLETCQEARCDAGRAVAGALNWPAVARELRQRNDFYAAQPWLRRRSVAQ